MARPARGRRHRQTPSLPRALPLPTPPVRRASETENGLLRQISPESNPAGWLGAGTREGGTGTSRMGYEARKERREALGSHQEGSGDLEEESEHHTKENRHFYTCVLSILFLFLCLSLF